MLEDVRAELAARGVRLGVAELHVGARTMLGRSGLIDAMGADMVFEDLEDMRRALAPGEG